MDTTTYEIPSENLARLTDKLDTLIRRAIKLGCEPPSYTIGEKYEKEVARKADDGFDSVFDLLDIPAVYYNEFVTYHTVTVSGSAPKIEGWRFAATCDYAELPVIIRALLTDVAIPERYRTCGAICEHCKLSRDRHECIILVHDDGRFIQVGKSCMRDFTGHKSPEHLAEMAELLRDLDDDCRGFADGRVNADPSLHSVLMWTSSVIGRHGWCPKSKADFDAVLNPNGREATAEIVSGLMGLYSDCLKSRKKFPAPLPTKDDFARAAAAVEYAQSLPGNSDYEMNVKAVAARSGVSRRNFGIACSIMGSYDRAAAERTAGVPSEFVGTVGRKVNCMCTKKTCKCAPIKVTVSRVISLPDYGYGVSYINIMRHTSGNALVWKTTTCLRTGSEYTLTGTVKEHDDSKYGKQTVLTRCKSEIILTDVDPSIAA